jgi:hypothetical protein
VSIPLAVIEQIVSASGAAEAIEELLPPAVRGRQLRAGTLLAGMMAALADGRPAHLTRVPEALVSLPEADQKRLGVVAGWKSGPHQLTYRQAGHTHRLIRKALDKQQPDGAASQALQDTCDLLAEASIPGAFKDASSSLAVDWTRTCHAAALVPMATPAPSHRPNLPLPEARPHTRMITNCRWSIRRVRRSEQVPDPVIGADPIEHHRPPGRTGP